MLDIIFGEGHAALHVFRVATWFLLFGGAAYKSGEALANRWRPFWQLAGYMLLLGCAVRFIVYALYFGELWSLPGYIVDTTILMMIGGLAYRFTMARNMVKQYPWLYARQGALGWRTTAAQSRNEAQIG